MVKKQVIRVGDRVKVITSKIVKRVGYPLIWTDIADEVGKDPRTIAAFRLLNEPPAAVGAESIFTAERLNAITTQTIASKSALAGSLFAKLNDEKLPLDFVRAAARMRVEEMNFGGNERQLIYFKTRTDIKGLFWSSDDEVADYTGQTFEVIGKKVAKTGVRFPAASGQHCDGEYWEEPGGLDDCKTHVLLETHAGWIEQVNVELIKRAPGSTDSRPAPKGRFS